MGDLYSNPIYNFDSIIVNHTKQIISNINNKFNYNNTICKDSYGFIC